MTRHRPDWRDPNLKVPMPCLEVQNNRVVGRVTVLVAPEEITRLASDRVQTNTVPGWRNDPSYHWSRK